MKRLLSDYYNKWYIPVLVASLLGIAGIFILSMPYEPAFYIGLGLPFLALLISGILGVQKLFKKQYRYGILQIIATVAITFVGLCFVVFYLAFYPYDYYADNLEIPKKLKLEIPKDSKNDVFNSSVDFKLYNGLQPGIYTYDISIENTGKGTVFLKAFEITHNDPLSVKELKFRSAITVQLSDTIKHYRLKEDFTIHEGDWDKPYAVRFEMWFRDSITGKETKLVQKNYKIEGWMR
jgi:hypothetical protein